MFTLIHICTTAPLRGSRLAHIADKRVWCAAVLTTIVQLFCWDLGPREYQGLLPHPPGGSFFALFLCGDLLMPSVGVANR